MWYLHQILSLLNALRKHIIVTQDTKVLMKGTGRKAGRPVEKAVEGLVKTIVCTIISVGVCHNGAEAVQLLLTVELAAKFIDNRHKFVAGPSITWAEACTNVKYLSRGLLNPDNSCQAHACTGGRALCCMTRRPAP